MEDYDDDYEDDYGTHYGEHTGTYAQDVAGCSDDVIMTLSTETPMLTGTSTNNIPE